MTPQRAVAVIARLTDEISGLVRQLATLTRERDEARAQAETGRQNVDTLVESCNALMAKRDEATVREGRWFGRWAVAGKPERDAQIAAQTEVLNLRAQLAAAEDRARTAEEKVAHQNGLLWTLHDSVSVHDEHTGPDAEANLFFCTHRSITDALAQWRACWELARVGIADEHYSAKLAALKPPEGE